MSLKFRDLTPIDWIGLFLPTVAVVVGTVVFVISGSGGVGWTTLVAVLITYLTAERVSRIAFEHEVRRNLIQQNRAELDLICLGSVEDGVRWFSDHFEGLARVENTVFTRGENSHIIDQLTWGRHLNGIRDAICDGCVWTDIASANQIDDLKALAAGLPDRDRKRYNLFSLNTGIPIIQCMTLRYKDGTARVLYGWDYASPNCKSDFVYLGKGERTVGYFRQYMASLEQAAERVIVVAPPQQPPPPPVTRQATAPPEQ